MIPIPSGVRVWIATGHTDMHRGMRSLALTVQESLKRDPHAGDLYIFGIPQRRLHELLPWEWKRTASNPAAAQAA
jgi:transposase